MYQSLGKAVLTAKGLGLTLEFSNCGQGCGCPKPPLHHSEEQEVHVPQAQTEADRRRP